MVKTATVLQSALLLCVWGALAQDFMSPNVNIIEELAKLKSIEQRLRTMEEKMQNQSVLVEQLQKENEALKTTVETMQAKLESLQSIKEVRNCGDYPTIEHGDVTEDQVSGVLKVRCAKLYKLEGPKEVRCVNRKWTQLPVCKAPCRLDQSKFHNRQREYMEHGEEDRFYCPSSYYRVYVKCENGRALYRGCGYDEW